MFAELPHEIRAAVLSDVIRVGSLRTFVVELHVAVGNGGSERVAPVMRVSSHRAESRDGFEMSGGIERSVVVDEVVVEVTEDPLAHRELHLEGILADVDAAREI